MPNVALQSNGGVATASSTYALYPYLASYVNDGIRDNHPAGAEGGNWLGWTDNTSGTWGDWIQVEFSTAYSISEIDVITLHDDFGTSHPSPTLTDTFTLYGLTAFDVQYWNGSSWVTVTGGSVTGNNKIWRQFNFTPVSTNKIRLVANGGADNTFARVVELEAWDEPPSSPVTGLIYETDFDDLTGWSADSDFAVDTARPTYIAAHRSPMVALSPTPASPDANGVRESNILREGGDWSLFYDAGDGTGGAGAPWRPQLATSANKGLSWAKVGPTNIGLDKTDNPADGAWPARGHLYTEKRGSTYYMEMMSAGSGPLPGQPYESDIFTASSPSGPWAFVRRSMVQNPSAGYDHNDCYLASHVLDSGTYQGFFGATDDFGGGAQYRIGRATSSSPDGPWTKIGSIIPDGIKGQPENPKVWWSAALNKWVMLVNQVATGFTDRNSLFFSDSLTDWSACYRRDIQGVFPADGTEAMGLGSPIYLPEGLPDLDDGYLGFTFDTDPTDFNHNGRKIFYSVLEPSATALEYTGISLNLARRTLANGDFEAEFAVEFDSLPGSDHVSFDFRIQANDDCYRLMVQGGDGLKFQKIVSGTPTDIGTPSGTLNTAVGWVHRIRVRAVGTTIQAWLDGQLQINTTDATWASGVEIGFAAGGTAVSRVRRFHIRKSSDVVIYGVTSGDEVTLRSWSGVPVATTTASESYVRFTTVKHYPIRGYEVNGTYTEVSGGIYGGDVIPQATNENVTPGVASLTTTTFAPSLALAVIPAKFSLITSTFAPTVNVTVSVIPGTSSLTLTGFAPIVNAGGNVTVQPAMQALAISAFAPTISLSDHIVLIPSTRSLTTTSFAPIVNAGGSITVQPGTFSLLITRYAPSALSGTLEPSPDRTVTVLREGRITYVGADVRIAT